MNPPIVALLPVLVAAQAMASTNPVVVIAWAPPRGEQGSVVGITQNVDRSAYGVAFFLNTYGTWWRKPYDNTPVLPLEPYLSWDAAFVVNPYWTGGIDQYSEYMAAFVVPLSYASTIPNPNGSWKLPDEIYSNAVCYTILDRRTPGDFINFAGYTWEKKVTTDGNTGSTWGPGPNYFNTNSIAVDAQGRLHLGVSFDYGAHGFWNCSELILTNSLGYGLYRFKVDTNVSSLPPEIVLGLFTWSDNPANAHQEIDVEFSNGDVVGAGTSNTWQNVIQPWYVSENRRQFPAPANMDKSVHEFLWTSNTVWFCNFSQYTNSITGYKVIGATTPSFVGSSEVASKQVSGATTTTVNATYPTGTPTTAFYKAALDSRSGSPAPFYAHTFSNNVPPFSDSQVHLNLWLSGPLPDGYVGQKYEVVISDFEFVPIASLMPQLEVLSVKTNTVTLGLTSQGN